MDEGLAKFLEECVMDPVKFIMGAFPWGEEGTVLFDKAPRAWQLEALEDIKNELIDNPDSNAWLAIASGHGIGKSTLISWIILWWICTRPDCNGKVTAGSESQLMNTVWRELYKWYDMSLVRDLLTWNNTSLAHNDSPSKWKIVAQPWNAKRPDSFAGQHGGDDKVLVIYDEASAIDDSIWEASDGAFTEKRGLRIAFGNPVRNSGRFRECFRKFKSIWKVKHIDSRDVEGTNKTALQQMVDTYGEDSDYVKVRIRGIFPNESQTQFIDYDRVSLAINATHKPGLDEPVILGVDVARHGDDASKIVIRQGRKMYSTIHTFTGLDTREFADKVAQIFNHYKADHICVDGIGVGAGVVDNLKHMGYNVNDINFSSSSDTKEYFNKRSECWGLMKDWLYDGDIPEDKELTEELTSIEYFFTNKGDIQLEPKKDLKNRIGRSPDTADALSLTFAKPFRPAGLRRRQVQRQRKPYSVFGCLRKK